ncbi:universal stress protein [Pseudomonas nitroreducens]|uniref:Universal stress protein n=1 Tax=Pseudomonas nitroreducens TaxID=46680 RepID=A0A246F5F2_PSENT|nr:MULTISPECIES: universal stress protein [Pseudomonas]MCG8910540.1 universal stress protein [Pseudomonas sp. DP-17]MDU4255138.1 universal stress protein [Pseudomonas sp.]OWP48438.1 universal stress protein [Pseudomonas nitroreducens]
MYEHVLAAVDGSPVSFLALAEGARLVRMSGGELHVITIVDRPLGHMPYYAKYYDAQALQVAAVKAADDILNKAREVVAEYAVPATFQQVAMETTGEEVADRIEIEADAVKADAIVMGTHSRHGLHRLVLGSVAEGVLQSSKRPVLLVRAR